MNLVREYEIYGYRVMEMDDGTFHLIQDDGSTMICEQEKTAEIMAYIMALRKELENERKMARIRKLNDILLGVPLGCILSVLVMLIA